jgi:hypothetical protein
MLSAHWESIAATLPPHGIDRRALKMRLAGLTSEHLKDEVDRLRQSANDYRIFLRVLAEFPNAPEWLATAARRRRNANSRQARVVEAAATSKRLLYRQQRDLILYAWQVAGGDLHVSQPSGEPRAAAIPFVIAAIFAITGRSIGARQAKRFIVEYRRRHFCEVRSGEKICGTLTAAGRAFFENRFRLRGPNPAMAEE